nr:hypothetical protein [Luteimonas lumbrici]
MRPGRRHSRPRPGAWLPRRRDHDRAVGARAAARARRLRRVLRVPRGPGRDPRPRGRQGRPHRVARRAPRRTGRAHAPPPRAHHGRRLRLQQRLRRRTPELCAVLAAGHVPVHLIRHLRHRCRPRAGERRPGPCAGCATSIACRCLCGTWSSTCPSHCCGCSAASAPSSARCAGGRPG